MLRRLHELAVARADFAFESTLAARSFAPMLTRLQARGYRVVLFYVWVRAADTSVRRVAERVRRGGHHVPEEDVRRRFSRSWNNALQLYLPLADEWTIFDNAGVGTAAIASCVAHENPMVLRPGPWQEFQRGPKAEDLS